MKKRDQRPKVSKAIAVKPKAAPNKTSDQKPKKLQASPMQIFRAEHKASERMVRTADGFDNFITRVGLRNDNSLSGGTYEFNLLTRNRIKLEQAYRGSWLAGKIIDCFAEDMTRAGIDITTSREDGSVKKIKSGMAKLGIWGSLRNVSKWGRLYGGSIGVLQIEGQDLSTPLDIETVSKGQFKGIVPFDRWQLNPVIQDPITGGPDMGLPSLYQIVNNPAQMEPGFNFTSIEEQTVHYSRIVRYSGIDLPYFQAITEMMWGESVLERLWDRLIAFDNATMSSASLIDRANLRTVGIEGLREIIAAGGEAIQGLYQMFDMMRVLQVNEGLTLLDKNDMFQSTSYTFAGLSDMLIQFSQQLAGAGDVPLVRLFGQSPAGLNSTGESDMRMYYDSVNAQQEAKFRNPMDTILRVMWRSELGTDAPDDMEFKFTPLWQMDATAKATNAKTTAETIAGAYGEGLIDRPTAMSELKTSSSDTGVFSNITDEMIDEAEAEADEPPLPGEADPNADPAQAGKVTQPGLNPNAKDPKVDPETKPNKSFGADAKPKWWQWRKAPGLDA